jgi:hypothetical protein
MDKEAEIIFEVRPKKWKEVDITTSLSNSTWVRSVYLISQSGDVENTA